jgi:hypothetical protein
MVKPATIRRELITLTAAIGHWHKEHGPLSSIPAVTMPDKPAAKSDWLDRRDTARLLAGALGYYRCEWSDVASRKVRWAWRRDREAMSRHAARFIFIGLYTGTRHAAVLGVRWMPSTDGGWIDLTAASCTGQGRASARRPSASRLSGSAGASSRTCGAGSCSTSARASRRPRSTAGEISIGANTYRRRRSSTWSPMTAGRSRSFASRGTRHASSPA